MIRIGMITCWYKNISMENYSRSLKSALERDTRLQVKIVTSNCFCRQKYADPHDLFGKDCVIVSIPYITNLTYIQGLLRILAFPAEILLHLLRALRYWRETKDCDIIHYQQSASQSFGIIPLFFLLLLPSSKKRIVTIHNMDRRSLDPKFRFLNKIYERATRIIVHSNSFLEFSKSLGINENKITVIFHGSPDVEQHDLERREITFFGAPEERKGIFTVLTSLKILKDKGVKLTVHLYGIYSEKEKDTILLKAKSMGIDDQLFWGSQLSETEFDKKMQESLFTFAVYIQNISGSSIVTRALANATPIIASNIGGIPEYTGEGGIIIPPNNPTGLAETMEMLLRNEVERNKLGKKGRERAQRLFSWIKIAEKTMDVYQNQNRLTAQGH